jgi:hypothetical protein
MTNLNQLILLEDYLDFSNLDENSYLLVAHNLTGMGGKERDLGFSIINFQENNQRNTVKDFYLVPIKSRPQLKEKEIYREVLESSFGDNPFLRYMIKTNQEKHPFLIEEKENLQYGTVMYGLLKLSDICLVDDNLHQKISDLLKEKEKIVKKFF